MIDRLLEAAEPKDRLIEVHMGITVFLVMERASVVLPPARCKNTSVLILILITLCLLHAPPPSTQTSLDAIEL